LEALTAGPHQEEKYSRVTVYRGKKRRYVEEKGKEQDLVQL
jgi:hypothetical protein